MEEKFKLTWIGKSGQEHVVYTDTYIATAILRDALLAWSLLPKNVAKTIQVSGPGMEARTV